MSDLTPEEEKELREFLSAWMTAKRAGRFIVMCFIGMLGFIVLVSQAWDVIKAKLGFP